MFQYQYTVPVFTATLTSSSTLTYSSTNSTVYADVSSTYEELLLTTGTYQDTYTNTSTTTYTIGDYYSTSTNTCDYSVTVSSQSESAETTNNAFSTTSTFATTHHSTDGTHSVTTRSVVVSYLADLQSSKTEPCGYTYYTIVTQLLSTTSANYTSYVYGTTTHDAYSTHTVSYRTFEVTKITDLSGTLTQQCDYLDSSTQSTSYSSDYSSYTVENSYTTTHDIYSIGIHTVSGKTREFSSSNVTITLSATRVSETTSTSVVNVYGNFRTTFSSVTSLSEYNTRSVVGFSNIPYPPFSNDSETAYSTKGDTYSTLKTISDSGNSYNWNSYTMSVTAGNSIGYSRGLYTFFATLVETSYVSQTEIKTTLNSLDINETTLLTTYYSTSYTGMDSNSAAETIAIVSLGEKTYITTVYGTTHNYSSQTSASSTLQTITNFTKQTSFVINDYSTFTITVSPSPYVNRTTDIGVKTSTRIVGTLNSASIGTTTTSTFTETILSTQSATTTSSGYSTSVYSYSSSGSCYYYSKFLRLNGEILYVPTLTASGTWRLSDAGFITTSWSNEPSTTTSRYVSSNYDSSFTSERAATLMKATFNKKCNTGVASLSMSPNNTSIYKLIPTPLSAVDTMMQNQNNDYELFGLQAYNRQMTSDYQGVSFGAGAFDETFGSSTSTYDYSAVDSMSAPIEARRIHPRDTISIDTAWTDAFFGTVLKYSTSNTVTRV